MSRRVALGTQGWRHTSWRGGLYRPGVPISEMLEVYARTYVTVEVDDTFHQLPAAITLRQWRDAVPEHFRFALKMPREVTHERCLQDVRPVLDRFLERVAPLGRRLGPIVGLLPPGFGPTEQHWDRLAAFVTELPRAYRWAIEFRNARWLSPRTLRLLADRGVAAVLADGRWMSRRRLFELCAAPAADFAYVRWNTLGRRFADRSRPRVEAPAVIAVWAAALAALADRGAEVFGYAGDHYQGHAPYTVNELQRELDAGGHQDEVAWVGSPAG